MQERTQDGLWLALAVAALAGCLFMVGLRMHQEPVTADGGRYRAMAVSLEETGEFRASYMPLVAPQPGEVEAGYTHYFSPLWPAVLVPFHLLLGEPGFELAYLVACGLALAAAWLAGRDLYGREAGLATLAVLGYLLYHNAPQRGSEPLALLLFVLMLYGILRSVRPGQQRWILLAGAAAGLAYLTRASVGWLFLLGGAAGFAWRVRFHRAKALNRHYLAAIGIFAACYGAWALRNLSHFWDGSLGGLPHALASDAVFQAKSAIALREPLRLAALVPLKLAWAGFLLLPAAALRADALLLQLRSLRDEEQSGLFLAWAVPLATGAVVAAIFTIADPTTAYNWDNLRYFLFAVPGLLWGPRKAPGPAPTPAAPAGP